MARADLSPVRTMCHAAWVNIGDYTEWRRHRFDRMQYACFHCRVCRKWPRERDASIAVAMGGRFARALPEPACAVCRKTLTCVGYTFHAPPRTDVRAWRRIERAYTRPCRP